MLCVCEEVCEDVCEESCCSSSLPLPLLLLFDALRVFFVMGEEGEEDVEKDVGLRVSGEDVEEEDEDGLRVSKEDVEEDEEGRVKPVSVGFAIVKGSLRGTAGEMLPCGFDERVCVSECEAGCVLLPGCCCCCDLLPGCCCCVLLPGCFDASA